AHHAGKFARPPSSVMKSRRFTDPVPPVLRNERIAHLATAGDRCAADLRANPMLRLGASSGRWSYRGGARTNERSEHASLGINGQIPLSSNITFEHPGTLDHGSDCRSHRGDNFSP